jgi:hypothetical protein
VIAKAKAPTTQLLSHSQFIGQPPLEGATNYKPRHSQYLNRIISVIIVIIIVINTIQPWASSTN